MTSNETELALLAEIGLFHVRNASFWYHYVLSDSDRKNSGSIYHEH